MGDSCREPPSNSQITRFTGLVLSCSSSGRLHVNVSAIAFVVRHPRVIAMRVMASFDFLVHPAVFHAFMFLFPRPLFFVRSGIRLSSQHCVVQRYHRSILGYWSARRCAQEFLMVSCLRFVSFMFSWRLQQHVVLVQPCIFVLGVYNVYSRPQSQSPA